MTRRGPALVSHYHSAMESPRSRRVRIEPMTAADWPAVRRIYAEGIATGDATLERERPGLGPLRSRPHPPDCRLVARDGRAARSSAGPRSGATRHGRSTAASPGRASTSAAEARGRGVGRALLEALIPASEAAGFWTLLAGVLVDNTASLALHEARRLPARRRAARDGPGPARPLARRGPAGATEPTVGR